jgi:hypothetical protein
MVLYHEESNPANRYDDSAEQAVIEKRQDQGVWNRFIGEVAVFGEGRDQSRSHPVVIVPEGDGVVVPINRATKAKSHTTTSGPSISDASYVDRTAEQQEEVASNLSDIRQVLRAKQIIKAASDPAELTRTIALQRRDDERHGR